jgi:Domain of Unknown Function (DUF1080)
MFRQLGVALALVAALAVSLVQGDEANKDGFAPMFNGKDLKGWVNVNGAPSTWYVKDDMIITTGKPTGYLRTEKQYENFIAEFDWMHVPPTPTAVGNSGFFVWCDPLPAVGTGYSRGIEVQVLVNLEKKDHYTSQGDLFSIWGAHCTPDRPHPQGWERCLPSENRCKGANEWNHYRVEANDGRLTLAVNGKVVSGVSKCNPRKGYLALEAEGSECRFRNLKIKELPGTNPKPEEICNVAQDFVPLFTGLDLSGWKTEDGHMGHWTPADTVLRYDGKATAKDPTLWTTKEYGDFEMIVDWRLPRKDVGKDTIVSGINLRGCSKCQAAIGSQAIGSGGVEAYRTDTSVTDEVRKTFTPKERADKPAGQWNRFVIVMKGDKLNVTLNGKPVIVNAELVGVDPTGPIGLQHTGEPIEFANLFIRGLK